MTTHSRIPYPCSVPFAGQTDPSTGQTVDSDYALAAAVACEHGMRDGLPTSVLIRPAPVVERPTADPAPSPPVSAAPSQLSTSTTAPTPAASTSTEPASGHGVILAVLLLAAAVFAWHVVPGARPLMRGTAHAVGSALAWWWRSRTERPPYVFGGIAFGAFLLVVGVLYGWSTSAGLVGLVGLGAALWLRRAVPDEVPAEPVEWWSESRLVEAFLLAGLLKMGTEVDERTGEKRPVRPWLGRHGQPQHDEHGTSVIVVLPRGMTWQQVEGKRDVLASGLDVPVAHLAVTHLDEDTPRVVRLRVGTTPPRATKRSTAPTDPRWGQLVRLGEDERGRVVEYVVDNVHGLIAGASGSGKTRTARTVALAAALDPHCRIYGLDGKGDGLDWSALVPSCVEFVDGVTDLDDADRLIAMLSEVLDESHRLRAKAKAAGVRPRPSVLLLLEEVYVARATVEALDKGKAKVLDGLVTRLLAGARSAGVHVLLITQRGTSTYLPNDAQANVTQRVVGQFSKPAEFAWALGDEPVKRPTQPGEFVVTTGGPQRFLVADLLDDDVWEDGCREAARRRGATSVRVPDEAPVVVVEAPELVEVDLLLDAVEAVLRDRVDPSPTEVHEALDPLLRPDTVAALSRYVGEHGEGRIAKAKSRDGKRRVWRLVAPATTQCHNTGATVPVR